MKKMQFKFYEDSAHGWLEVPIALIEELGVADRISRFSYKKGDLAYLEEDCDMEIFANAYSSKYGEKVGFTRIVGNSWSFIRNLPRWK